MTSRTIALIGATGFVGGGIARHLLKAGWSLRLLCRRLPVDPALSQGDIAIVIGDLQDRAALKQLASGVTAVIHCGGIVKARKDEDFFAVNSQGTEALLTTFRDLPSRPPFLYISSLAARAPHLSAYAASKAAAEQLIRHEPGLTYSILRPPAVYGPGDVEFLPLFRWMAKGRVPVAGNGAGRLSLIHIDDLAASVPPMLQAILESRTLFRQEDIWEIDDGHPNGYSWADIADAASMAFDRRLRMVHIPKTALWLTAFGASVAGMIRCQPRMIHFGKVREIFHRDWVIAPKCNLNRALGLKPRFDLPSGFADTLAHYRARHLLRKT